MDSTEPVHVLVLCGFDWSRRRFELADTAFKRLLLPLNVVFHYEEAFNQVANLPRTSSANSWYEEAFPADGGDWATMLPRFKRFFDKQRATGTPYLGIIGHSQGASCAAALVAEQDCGRARLGLRFAVFANGYLPPKVRNYPLYESDGRTVGPDLCSTLHVLGEQDRTILPHQSEELFKKFRGAKLIRHPGEHYIIPFGSSCGSTRTQILDWFRDRTNDIRKKSSPQDLNGFKPSKPDRAVSGAQPPVVTPTGKPAASPATRKSTVSSIAEKRSILASSPPGSVRKTSDVLFVSSPSRTAGQKTTSAAASEKTSAVAGGQGQNSAGRSTPEPLPSRTLPSRSPSIAPRPNQSTRARSALIEKKICSTCKRHEECQLDPYNPRKAYCLRCWRHFLKWGTNICPSLEPDGKSWICRCERGLCAKCQRAWEQAKEDDDMFLKARPICQAPACCRAGFPASSCIPCSNGSGEEEDCEANCVGEQRSPAVPVDDA